VSETVLDHGYIPEEHAPDPVIGHGDPTPPGKVAIWLFLASEVMFFIGILGTYIIFRSGAPAIFAEHAEILSKPLAGVNTLVLIFSSLTMALAVDASQMGNRSRVGVMLLLTFLCACGFMGIKAIEYADKFTHHTVVAKDPADGKLYVYDGHSHGGDENTLQLEAVRMPLPERNFDIHWISAHGIESANAAGGGAAHATGGHAAHQAYDIPRANISQDVNYGPWKNIFYACYFTLTGIHGVHVLGGMVPISFLLIQSLRGKLFPHHTEYVGLYWHFVDLVWIFLFPLLYLI
jgi:cytochrome c oxidase subunit 3